MSKLFSGSNFSISSNQINRSDQRHSILGPPPPLNFGSNNSSMGSNQSSQYSGGNYGGNYGNNYGSRDQSGLRDLRGGRGNRYSQNIGMHSGNGRSNNQLGPNNFNDAGHYENRYMTGSRSDYAASNVGINSLHPGEMGYSVHSNHFAPTFPTDAPLNGTVSLFMKAF